MGLNLVGLLGVAVLCMSAVASAGTEVLKADFADLSAVYKEFKPRSGGLGKKNTSWLKYAYAKGATKVETAGLEIQYFSTRTGEYLFSDYFTTTVMSVNAGTVIAFPKGVFNIERAFTYIGLDERGKKTVLKGMWISVDVVIGYPNADKPPSEHACDVVIRNLGDTGMMIPMNTGKPGKIIAVKEAAKKRFGASMAQAYYHRSEEGKIMILLLRCNADKENSKIIPATYDGAATRK